MPRDLPIGNGRLFVAFDKDALLRELHFPHVGEENHMRGEGFRFGVWVDGQLYWIPAGWEIERDYLSDSLVTRITFFHPELGLRIIQNDLIDFELNLYLRKVSVENLRDEPRDIQLFFGQDFYIYGNEIGDTATFRPENKSLIHYKNERYFLINIRANNTYGIDLFATGNKGTWQDAEDGILSGNPIAQGAVDSAIAIPLTLASRGTESCSYWIAAGKNWEEVSALDEIIRKKGPETIFQRTFDYWHVWANKEPVLWKQLPEKLRRLYKRSLLICRSQINNCGSIIAANDSDSIYFNRDTYSYMWPRDSSLVAYALDSAGYALSVAFFHLCGQIVEKDGYFLHKYTPSGALASSWHAWVKDKKTQLPIQEDETALVLWALWHHYTKFRDIEMIRTLYNPLIKKCADFLMNYRDMETGLPLPSYDLWEERQGILTFTVSTVYGGLIAAANFTELFGERELAEEYRQGAAKMREGMDRYLYLKEEKRFARMVNFKEDGSLEVDATIDASLYGIFTFGAYSAHDEKVKNTMDQVLARLWIEPSGGYGRYENDDFYQQNREGPSNPWIITTLWMAQYFIAIDDLNKALEILEWVADRALPSGVLAEQINPLTKEPLSVSPLTWSHGAFIAAVQEYLQRDIFTPS